MRRGSKTRFAIIFKRFFSSSEPSDEVMEKVVATIPQKIADEMNQMLTAPFTKAEVYRALFQSHSTKAPGPDGFSTGFYQRHWEIVGPSLTHNCLAILNNQASAKSINFTFIALIPKVKNHCPIQTDQFMQYLLQSLQIS